jgi:hypothetical protein
MADATRNAQLSYTADGNAHSFPLFVEEVNQAQSLSVSTAQSRLFKQVYPRSHMPGNISIQGRAVSQGEFQRLGLFVRRHHKALISSPANINFTRLNINSPGYTRMLRLSIPTEGIIVRGFVQSFKVRKRGVFEPAPTYNFDFVVIFDPHSTKVEASSILRQYYDKSDKVPLERIIISKEGQAEFEGDIVNPGIIDESNVQHPS